MDSFWHYWPAIVVAVAGCGLLVLLRSLRRRPPCRFELRSSLLTRDEQRCHAALHSAIGGDWLLFARVRLGDLVKIETQPSHRHWWQMRVDAQQVDFVICDHYNLRPLLAIILDDPSRARSDRGRRGSWIADTLDAAELPLLKLKPNLNLDPKLAADSQFSVTELRDEIDRRLPVSSRPRDRKLAQR